MEYKKETICIQGGWQPKNGEPRVLPIYQSTTFKYETSEEMGKLFDLEAAGYFYSRLQNPTNDYVAQKICDLEGGVAAMLTSSGQAATMFAVTNICEAGDHLICASKIYGGTSNLLTVTLERFGIEVTLVDQDAQVNELEAAFKPNTKLVLSESISNPAGVILDIEKFAEVAHKNGVPLICDNTFATPIHCRPIEFGADIIIHSTTKYMDGHAMAVGGCIVDSGNFKWDDYGDKYAGLTTPDESYHGVVYTERFGKGAYITKATVQLMRDMGACQSPQNAFLTNIGLETLHLRMPRHYENALKVAEFLEASDKIEWVEFAGLKSSKYYELAQKYMPDGTCGVLCFGPKGGKEGAMRFANALKMIAIVTHVADSRSCILHPASHTHRQLQEDQLIAAGISPDLVRFSVGTENIEDIIEDLQQALETI